MFIIFITSFAFVYAAPTWQTPCNGLGSGPCTATGFCYFTSGSNCWFGECHKVTDIRACRITSTGYLTSAGSGIGKCIELPSVNPNFQNQCREVDQTTLMWSYVRFPVDITQTYSTQTMSGYLATQIMTAKYTAVYKYEVLTLNILSASTTELLNIMTAYVQMQYDLCDNTIHPMYIEKAIYETLQAIRDDVALYLKDTNKLKQKYYTVLWRMTDAYFLKMRAYGQQYYISNKYLANFGFTNLNRQSISISTQYQTTQIIWNYAANGYLELLLLPAEQFGFVGMNSDVMIIKPTGLDGKDAILSYTITWSWTYSGNQPIQGTTKLYPINKTEMIIGNSVTTGNCNTSTKVCTFSISNQSGTLAYVIYTTADTACNTRYYSRCRLGWCIWSGSGSSAGSCA